MGLDPDQLGSLVAFGFAAANGFQARRAFDQDRAMRTRWPRFDAMVVAAEAEPEFLMGEATIHLLRIVADVDGQRVEVKSLNAQTEEEQSQLARRHPAGSRVSLMRDPRFGVVYVVSHAPHPGWRWLTAAVVGLIVMGAVSWTGLAATLFPGPER